MALFKVHAIVDGNKVREDKENGRDHPFLKERQGLISCATQQKDENMWTKWKDVKAINFFCVVVGAFAQIL